MTGRAAALIALLPAIAAADRWDGTYRQAANAECALVGVDGGSLRIAGGVFYGVDMQCRMTEPVNVTGMDAQLFTMVCSGEGSQWTERAMVMRAAEGEGILMVWNGWAFRYDRCPE